MTKQEAIDHFGGKKNGGVSNLADALGITVQAIYDWPEDTVPMLRQYELHALTKGRLKVGRQEKKTA